MTNPALSKSEFAVAIAAAVYTAVTLRRSPIEMLGPLADYAQVTDAKLFEVHVQRFDAFKFGGAGAADIEFSCAHPYNGSEFTFSHTFPLTVSGHFDGDAACVDYASIDWQDVEEGDAEPTDPGQAFSLPTVVFLELDPEELAYHNGGPASGGAG